MKRFFFAAVCTLLLSCPIEAAAQPTCAFSYPVSLDCPDSSGDTVVLGRVATLTHINPQTGEESQTRALGFYPRGRVVAAVEEVFKGSAGAVIEFTVHGGCYGPIEEGRRYIFNIYRTSGGYTNQRWSGTLDYLTRSDATKFRDALRSLIRGERLSNLFGTLRDRERLQAIQGITVVAEKNGLKFRARTDATGRYEFRKLAEGEYKVYPLLSPALRPVEYSGLRHARPGDTARVLKNAACGVRLDFMASYNGVISGRVDGPDGKPFASAAAILLKFDSESKSPTQYREYIRQNEPGTFSFVDLPPGRYLIEVFTPAGPGRAWIFYYPGVVYQRDARIINVAGGQRVTGIIVKLPPSSKTVME